MTRTLTGEALRFEVSVTDINSMADIGAEFSDSTSAEMPNFCVNQSKAVNALYDR